MPAIAFLLGDTRTARHDHHQRLPAAFRRAGWRVTEADTESVALTPVGVTVGGLDPADFTLIWVLGMGRQPTFLDRMQLLNLLPQRSFVVSTDALLYRHAKYAWWPDLPETHASADPDQLKARLAAGGDWVVKPPAGSFGRDVTRIRNDAAGRAAIDRLCGAPEAARYLLLQRYVPEVENGEKRTLVAGGRIIGTYLRRPDVCGSGDFRANLAAGAEAAPATLTAPERQLVERLAAELVRLRIGFAAVDTAFPYLMEVNVANPGGLSTLAQLYGADPAPRVVDALAGWPERTGAVSGRLPESGPAQ